jgi:hypothetical protein
MSPAKPWAGDDGVTGDEAHLEAGQTRAADAGFEIGNFAVPFRFVVDEGELEDP